MEYGLESLTIAHNVQTPDPGADLERRSSLRVPRMPNILVSDTILGVLLSRCSQGSGTTTGSIFSLPRKY